MFARKRCLVLLLILFLACECACSAPLSPALVRAVFPVEQRDGQLVTSQFVFCTNEEHPATVASSQCGSGGGVLVQQNITWNSMLPPGIYPRNVSIIRTARDAVNICAGFLCDMFSYIQGQINRSSIVVQDGMGGFTSTFPCSSCVNSTFILFTSNNTIVQANVLPLVAIANDAAATVREHYCGNATTACATSCSLCLIRLLDPRYYVSASTSSWWEGDGNLLFPVKLSMCSHSLSTIFSYDDGALLGDGYTALLTVREHADSISMPWELIRALASWIPKTAGSSASLLHADNCQWRTNATMASFYRTGEYFECRLPPSLQSNLPPLSFSVDRGRIIRSATSPLYRSSSCVFTVDLNDLVEGGVLRLFSSGSLTAAHKLVATSEYREPVIAIGVMLLRGGTVAVTRSPVLATSVPLAWRSLPLLYLGVAKLPTNDTSMCTPTLQCTAEEHYYEPLNLCGKADCRSYYCYSYLKDSMTCKINRIFVALFVMMFVLTAGGEFVVIYLRKRMKRNQDAHMRLVELVQRKNQ